MPQPGRSWAKGFDWPLAAVVLALTAVGLAAIHSATHGTVGAGEWGRQAVYLLPAALGAAVLVRDSAAGAAFVTGAPATPVAAMRLLNFIRKIL